MRTLLALFFLSVFTIAVEPPPTPRAGIPASALFYEGKWYQVYAGKLDWEAARDHCKKLGGQLAVVPDEGTWKFLIKKITGAQRLWLGASDELTEGQWQWLDGTTMKFTAWGGGLPDNGENKENYLAMWGGTWNDVAKDNPEVTGFICEWKQ